MARRTAITLFLALVLSTAGAQSLQTDARSALVYSTYAGNGSVERALGVAVDASGSAVVLTSYAGSILGPRAMVKKFSPDGGRMIFSTTLPGVSLFDDGLIVFVAEHYNSAAITMDAAGDVYVAGTIRPDLAPVFPCTPGAAQGQPAGGIDAFVMKLSADGARVIYASFIGGSGFDVATGIAVDSEGNAFVTGFTNSTDFPVTPGAFQTSAGGDRDVFVVKVNPTGTAFLYATLLGAAGSDMSSAIAVGTDRSAYVAGLTNSENFPNTASFSQATCMPDRRCAFISRLNAQGSALLFSTHLGAHSYPPALAIDAAGDAYITAGMNTAEGGSHARAARIKEQSEAGIQALTKIHPEGGGQLIYATIIDGVATGIAVNPAGETFLTGFALGLQTTEDAYQRVLSGNVDAFLTRLGPNGQVVYSTFIGGTGNDAAVSLALDPESYVYLVGESDGGGFPTTSGAYLETYKPGATVMPFLAKMDSSGIPGGPEFIAAGVWNAASLRPGPIAPGEMIGVAGRNFGSPGASGFQLTSEGKVDTMLAETRLLFDGVPAPLLSVGASKLTAVVPYAVDGKASCRVEIEYKGVRSLPVDLPVAIAAPALFTSNPAYMTGQAAALNQDNTRNSATNPAPAGSVITLFATGEGQTVPAGVDGQLAASLPPSPLQPVVVGIGGFTAEVLYAGGAPGQIAGVFQVNVRVPGGLVPNPAVPIWMSVGGQITQGGITIAVGESSTQAPAGRRI